MIEIVPFMLFLIEWQPAHPGEFDLQRQPVIFRTVDECRLRGEALVKTGNANAEAGAAYAYACTELPSGDEVRDAFSRPTDGAAKREIGDAQ